MAGTVNVMARQSGTTSSGVTEDPPHLILSVVSDTQTQDRRFNSLREANNAMNQSQTVTPKIQKVPHLLRDNFVRQYEPTKVSFGPIHHQHQRGKDRKRKLMNEFVQASGKEGDVLYRQIRQIIKQLRDCFDEEVNKYYDDDDVLAKLLCQDGCAILQSIYSAPTQIDFHDIAQDILLLENQIPYKVLKELMQLSDKKEELEKSIETFIEESVMVRGDNLPSQANLQRAVQIDEDHAHLLDLLRKTLLGVSQAETLNQRRDSPPFRNVQELKAAGIHLKQSSDKFLSNISFRRRFHLLGCLYLPPITVDHSARLKFLNLVAYEMCLQNDRGVMSYLSFLHSLINEAQDVKELRDAGVLYNSFGSDTQLQNLFSEICGELPGDTNYIGVKEKIQEYYETWMSGMHRRYHAWIKGSSWPLVTFLGGLLGLLFSGTQTWFTVKTWFSVSPASPSHREDSS